MTAQAGAVAALLPCPFCGATPVPSKTCIECDSCGTEGPVYMAGLIGAPVTQWNKRAATPAAVSVEALEGLAAEWEAEAAALLGKSKRAANHVAAGGLNTRAAQLRKLIKERSNG